ETGNADYQFGEVVAFRCISCTLPVACFSTAIEDLLVPHWQSYLEDIIFSFRKHKELAEKAFRQVGDEGFFKKPGEHSNSIAVIIKHVAGNLASRWTDFLTTDGDKPWRDRDAEFVIGPDDSRRSLLAAWEGGWTALFQTLGNLQET